MTFGKMVEEFIPNSLGPLTSPLITCLCPIFMLIIVLLKIMCDIISGGAGAELLSKNTYYHYIRVKVTDKENLLEVVELPSRPWQLRPWGLRWVLPELM